MGKKFYKKIGAIFLTIAMIVPILQANVNAIVNPMTMQAGNVEGTLTRAPSIVNLEENGNLDWIHCNVKEQSQWAGAKNSLIKDITLSGNLAQIMNDTDSNFIYPNSLTDNHKGQVINGLGGKTTFTLPSSNEKRYVSIFTGSWASQIKLTVYINNEEKYSNIHGKTATTSGAESYLTQFSYHTDNNEDIVKVVIETIEVFDSTYGNQSIQAIALSDHEQKYDSSVVEGLVNGELVDAPSYINLTKQGQLDWIHLDSAQFGSFNRKNILDAGITNLTLIGKSDYVTDNVKTDFRYSDGMSNLISPDNNKKALVFTGIDNGFSFNVPGSIENRYLDIYTGAWAADINVTIEINGTKAYEKIFGSNVTTSGSPAVYRALKLDYHTDKADDVVKVTVKVDKVYDSKWGNMNIGGITLGTERVKDDGSLVGGIMRNAPASTDLTQDGKLDWIYLNNEILENHNKKNIDNHLINNIKLIGKAQSSPIVNKAKTTFMYNDGITPVEESNGHSSYVFQGKGSGLEFDLPGSSELKYVNFYAGAWAADVKLEVLVNNVVQYTTNFGSSSTVPDTTNYQVARIQYKTVNDDDLVKIRATVTKSYDTTWSNMNVSAITISDQAPINLEETIKTDNWIINHSGGEISELKSKIAGEMYNIPVRTDQYSGFVWSLNGEKILLSSINEDDEGNIIYTGSYKKNNIDLTLTMKYSVNEQEQLVVNASIKNNKGEEIAIDQASIQIGFNTYLEKYPDYNDQLFPTLLRCEKTHAWGYFSTPSGRIMTIATDNPVASYTFDYQSGAHRIYSASLDVLQSGKLPERHPQDYNKLSANEEKSWNIYLKPIDDLNAVKDVKGVIANNTSLPMFDADRYTLAQNEESIISLLSQSPIKENKLVVEDPNGKISNLTLNKGTENIYNATFKTDNKVEGVYKITAENEAGYKSEMSLSIRKDWSWYIQKARQAAVEAPQKGTSHAESYYGMYSGYIAKKYFPDAKWDEQIDEKFEEIYPLMYDVNTGLPTSWQNRIQNHSTTLGIFIDQYQSSGNIESLKKAEDLADYLMTKQKADGGYYNGNTDYTSVIYPAKSIMELVHVEKELMEDETLNQTDRNYYQERYNLHMASLTKAMDKLVRVDGNFDTEGQATFEDGANSCSITQLSEFALMFPEGSSQRQKYTEAAVKYIDRHTSHQQTIIPDSRMNGGTLRFWEAQYDVEMGLTSSAPNMMNSPHGWSAWNIYGLFNLYELTGNVDYLERGMNAMGSCAQLMGYDGILNWAFIADPQRDTNFFVKDEEASIGEKIVGKHIKKTIGEEYVPMISYWWKAPKNTWVPGYTAMGGSVVQGAACDNDVHEIFKAMGEVALTKAYVVEKEDGKFETYNATVKVNDNEIKIIPSEDVVSNVSVQLINDKNVSVDFYNGTKKQLINGGNPTWITTKENAVDTSSLDKDSSLKSLDVSGGKLDQEFDKDLYNYSVDIGNQTGEIVITPTASSDKAIIYIDGNKIQSNESYTIQLNSPLMEKEVKIIVKSEMQAQTTTYTIKVSNMGNCEIIPTKGQSAIAGSQHSTSGTEGPAANVLDGDISTIWHTNYSGGTIPMKDRWIEIKLAERQTICGLRYLPRQSGDNGKILGYEIYISNDNGQNYNKVTEGQWDISKEWKTATFDVITATNIRLVPTQTSGDFGSASEIRIIGLNTEVNKDVLNNVVNTAEALNKEDYTESSWNAMQEVLTSAKDLLSKNVTQNEIDNMVTLLQNAIDSLIKAELPATNKVALSIALDMAKSVTQEQLDKVVPIVANEFKAALENAQNVFDNAKAAQDEIDAAFNRLADVMWKLEFYKGD
ncbi:discoidin domain-containing protein, partial [Thomasclavelia sp.]